MVNIDKELLEQLNRAGGRPVPIIITCQSECESIVKDLEQAGIRIISKESIVLGTISAEITIDQIEIIREIPGVCAVEYDQEAKALD